MRRPARATKREKRQTSSFQPRQALSHQPMSSEASPPSPTDASRAHHGHLEGGESRQAMDGDPEALRGPVAPATSPTKPDIITTDVAGVDDRATATVADAAPVKSESEEITTASPPAEAISKAAMAAAVGEGGVSERGWGGPLLFCQKEYAPSRPHPTQDLFALFGLTPLAASVARIDPVTKEKINKMRSSYQNQVKGFQLAGRNKAVKHEDGVHGMSLSEMVAWPEEEWRNQKVKADLSKGVSDTVMGKLEKAFKLDATPVPKNDEWESILGFEKGKQGGAQASSDASKSKQPAAQGASKAAKVNGHTANGVSKPAGTEGGEVARPRRAGKKRRYDDESFEGYGEGYVDDKDDPEGGYSSGGSRGGSISKKKRRKDFNSISPPVGGGVGSYGVGMVQQQHVGRGIGAFGGR